jgi:hypothetical protein
MTSDVDWRAVCHRLRLARLALAERRRCDLARQYVARIMIRCEVCGRPMSFFTALGRLLRREEGRRYLCAACVARRIHQRVESGEIFEKWTQPQEGGNKGQDRRRSASA